jgi:hypothetical protein
MLSPNSLASIRLLGLSKPSLSLTLTSRLGLLLTRSALAHSTLSRNSCSNNTATCPLKTLLAGVTLSAWVNKKIKRQKGQRKRQGARQRQGTWLQAHLRQHRDVSVHLCFFVFFFVRPTNQTSSCHIQHDFTPHSRSQPSQTLLLLLVSRMELLSSWYKLSKNSQSNDNSRTNATSPTSTNPAGNAYVEPAYKSWWF